MMGLTEKIINHVFVVFGECLLGCWLGKWFSNILKLKLFEEIFDYVVVKFGGWVNMS